jgi:hypothetical protein
MDKNVALYHVSIRRLYKTMIHSTLSKTLAAGSINDEMSTDQAARGRNNLTFGRVGKEGLEPSRLTARDPKSRLSANSSTSPKTQALLNR